MKQAVWIDQWLSLTHNSNEDVSEDEGTKQYPQNNVQCRLKLRVVNPQFLQQSIPLVHCEELEQCHHSTVQIAEKCYVNSLIGLGFENGRNGRNRDVIVVPLGITYPPDQWPPPTLHLLKGSSELLEVRIISFEEHYSHNSKYVRYREQQY